MHPQLASGTYRSVINFLGKGFQPFWCKEGPNVVYVSSRINTEYIVFASSFFTTLLDKQCFCLYWFVLKDIIFYQKHLLEKRSYGN